MLFNSYVFCFAYLPLVLFGYHFLNRHHKYGLANGFLLAASLLFYAYFRIEYLAIIVISIFVNYGIGKWMSNAKTPKKVILALALLFNLGILGVFKYYDFVLYNVSKVIGKEPRLLHLVLPLGISFFTFQQISYVVDCYRENVGGSRPNISSYGFLEYALFVSYFPQLIAGPIVTHEELVPQFMNREKRQFCPVSAAIGLTIFSLGLAKKVLLADTFGNAVNYGFSNVDTLSALDAILIMLSYTFQVYFDFSGYSDMAIGIGRMMNIELPINFDSPYRALSINEFWKRWHMTLTRFFQKYVYIPMGGNRKGKSRTYFNIFAVFLLSGIWHGANWTFVLWGVIHGIACIIDRATNVFTEKWHPVIRWALTFLFVNVAWVYFRADSIQQANQLLAQIGSLKISTVNSQILDAFYPESSRNVLNLFVSSDVANSERTSTCIMLLYFAFAWVASINFKNVSERLNSFKPTSVYAIVTAMLLCWSIISFSKVSTFLYFNF